MQRASRWIVSFADSFVAAASTYINLAAKESDNNVKLIVLDRLDTLHSRHGHVLDVLIMDIVQILTRFVSLLVILLNLTLSSPDLEVRRKTLSIVLSMTSSRNVEEIVMFLKKQLQKTQDQSFEKVIDLNDSVVLY